MQRTAMDNIERAVNDMKHGNPQLCKCPGAPHQRGF